MVEGVTVSLTRVKGDGSPTIMPQLGWSPSAAVVSAPPPSVSLWFIVGGTNHRKILDTIYSTRVSAPASTPLITVLRESPTHDESTTANLSGTGVDEGALRKRVSHKKPEKLASCKKVFKVGTLNVRTIGKRKEHLKQEMVYSFLESNLDILGIQELA